MKKNMLSCGGAFVSLALLFTISSFSFSCASNKKAVEPVTESAAPKDIKPKFNFPVNHSYLTEKNIGENLTVKGRLLKDENSFILLENAKSKSRVTFTLEFEETQDFSKDFISSLLNKEVEISGILTSVQSTWVKGIKVVNISSL